MENPIKWMIQGYPYFRKPPYIVYNSNMCVYIYTRMYTHILSKIQREMEYIIIQQHSNIQLIYHRSSASPEPERLSDCPLLKGRGSSLSYSCPGEARPIGGPKFASFWAERKKHRKSVPQKKVCDQIDHIKIHQSYVVLV